MNLQTDILSVPIVEAMRLINEKFFSANRAYAECIEPLAPSPSDARRIFNELREYEQSLVSPDRIKAETGVTFIQWLQDMAANLCPVHKTAISKRQVGNCVYAEPCGCHLYQGRLSANEN